MSRYGGFYQFDVSMFSIAVESSEIFSSIPASPDTMLSQEFLALLANSPA